LAWHFLSSCQPELEARWCRDIQHRNTEELQIVPINVYTTDFMEHIVEENGV